MNTADDAGEFDQLFAVPELQGQGSGVQFIKTGILNVNGTTILVPPLGISIVSDIDDMLQITKGYVPSEASSTASSSRT